MVVINFYAKSIDGEDLNQILNSKYFETPPVPKKKTR
jgi:hypothetical protein